MKHALLTLNLALVALLLAVAPAHAEGDALLFTGAEFSGHRSNYGQVGAVVPLPGNTFGNGFVVRGAAYGLTYKYENAGRDIDGDAVGGELTAGYQSSGAPGWWAFYTGPTYRHTSLSPNDPASKADGGNAGWIFQGEGERKLTQDIKLALAGNYVVAENSAFWTRVRLLYRIDGEMFAGPEGIYQGDEDYNAWAVGAGLFGIALDDNTLLGVKGGVRKVEDFSLSPYGGFELGYTF